MLGPSLLRSSWLPNSSPDLWLSGAEPWVVLFKETNQPKGQCQGGADPDFYQVHPFQKAHLYDHLKLFSGWQNRLNKENFQGRRHSELDQPSFSNIFRFKVSGSEQQTRIQ